jgi:hypothetical protein
MKEKRRTRRKNRSEIQEKIVSNNRKGIQQIIEKKTKTDRSFPCAFLN